LYYVILWRNNFPFIFFLLIFEFIETGYALRGLYIIDAEGVLQYSVIHPEAVGRNSQEVLRVIKALQSGKMTPCNWEPGQDTIN